MHLGVKGTKWSSLQVVWRRYVAEESTAWRTGLSFKSLWHKVTLWRTFPCWPCFHLCSKFLIWDFSFVAWCVFLQKGSKTELSGGRGSKEYADFPLVFLFYHSGSRPAQLLPLCLETLKRALWMLLIRRKREF